jgi:1,4-alpha-glucan branching enzyme
MLDYPAHAAMRDYVRSLNNFYLSNPELWQIDFSSDGFRWILADESDKNSVAFRRIATDGSSLIFVINLSGSEQTYTIATERARTLVEVFATDYRESAPPVSVSSEGDKHTATLSLPPFFGVVYREKYGNKHIKI